MSFMDRIREANTHDPSRFVPFTVEGVTVGCVKAPFRAQLLRWPDVFRVSDRGVGLTAELERLEVAERSDRVAGVLVTLRDEGVIPGWRDEVYPVNRHFPDPPRLLIERAAVPFFGVCGYGVHVNGYVRDGGEIKMWIARRALTKPTGPGKLDQMVAGGQPAGIGLGANVTKECGEEAGIPRDLAERALPVGAISYVLETPAGLRPDVIFNYDLELPPDFEPANTDGEVEAFYLWPMARVMETVRDSGEFKFNCALVVIDFLIRHGFIAPDHPDYMALVRGLVTPNPLLQP